jgi:hypothetical protein
MNKLKLIPLTPGAVTVAAPWTSREILVQGFDEANTSVCGERYCSLGLTFTGAGRTIAATVVCSNGTTFSTTESFAALLSGKSAGSYHVSFTVPVCRAFKLILTATTDTCTVTNCIIAMT